MRFVFLFFLGFNIVILAQEKTKDSLKIFIKDSLKIKNLAKNPVKASLYSAVLPGLGQWYNGKKIKAPLVLGAVGTAVGFSIYFDQRYNQYRNAYINSLNGLPHEFSNIPNLTADKLGRAQDRAKRNRDYSIAITTLIYILNIIDATVDAHLSDFKVDKDLAIKPVIIQDFNQYEAKFGLALNFNF